MNGIHIGEAPSKEFRTVIAGPQTIRFVSERGKYVEARYEFEDGAFYIFQVDIPNKNIERLASNVEKSDLR